MNSREDIIKIVKFSIMLIMGIIITIKPNSLLSILLFILGCFLIVSGSATFISTLKLVKYRKGWVIDGVKTLAYLGIGISLVFNAAFFANVFYGVLSIIIGVTLIFIGIMAIIRTTESSSGLFFIIVGILIALFPLGFSYFVIRIIGVSLIALSAYLLFSVKSRSS